MQNNHALMDQQNHYIKHVGIFERRLRIFFAIIFVVFVVVASKLVYFGFNQQQAEEKRAAVTAVQEKPRPDIVDRNGIVLASDKIVPSLFANPRKIEDVEGTLDQLLLVFPDLNLDQMRKRLNSNARFAWIQREISDEEKEKVNNLGLPGLFFTTEKKRVYPNDNMAAHVLGHVNIDHEGKAGVEGFLNYAQKQSLPNQQNQEAGKLFKPLVTSIDLNVQNIMHEELTKSMEKFSAIAAMGLLMDVDTGEVISMVSLPDYDPNTPKQALEKKRMNRPVGGVFELGSIFKLITTGMALDAGVTTMEGGYDATNKLSVGRGKFIGDFHAKKRYLTVPEIFKYSSNIGTGKMALDVGKDNQIAFYKKLRLLDPIDSEIAGAGRPQYPPYKTWKRASTITISYGHGISVTPLQMVSAAASMMNGGYYVPPTFLKRSIEDAEYYRQRVIKPETSRDLVSLMRLNVLEGSGKKANVKGYLVGGKTGSADKPIAGGYSKDKQLTSFLSVFPTDKPKYMMLVTIDEPQGLEETHGYRTAGWNATPATGNIIKRIAPLMGLAPRFDNQLVNGQNLLKQAANN